MSPWVVGVDPAMGTTGVALGDGSVRTIVTHPQDGDRRLHTIAQHVQIYTQGADLVVLEDLPTHARAAGILGQVQGVIRLTLITEGIPYVTVPPSVMKKYGCGRGNGTKADLRMSLFQRTGIDNRNDNEVDALWLRAIGLDLLGQPEIQLPKANREVLAKLAPPSALKEFTEVEKTLAEFDANRAKPDDWCAVCNERHIVDEGADS